MEELDHTLIKWMLQGSEPCTKGRIIDLNLFLKKNFFRKRKKLDDIKSRILKMLERSGQYVTFERTSEIFITKGKKAGESKLRYYCMLDGFIVSHLIIRTSYLLNN